jgi:hypothetical protein
MSDENKMRDVSWHQYSEMCKIAEQAEAENDELRVALQAFANEICQRRMFGFVQDAVFEAVSNNQLCRTALTDTGYKGVK